MNTVDDLRDEFAALAVACPADEAVRTALAVRVARREKRRRTVALASVAAAVVLVAGGIGVSRGLLSGGSGPARPAAPDAVVPVPEVPLPADTQLIRHHLQPVTSPVTATPPDGLGGMAWMQSPGRLSVSFFDRTDATGDMVVTSDDSPERRSAGYVVTDAADDPVRTFGQGGVKDAQVTKRSTRVGDRDATLESAPSGATDAMGFPAAQRLSWRLPDGRYIHVWATGLPARDSSPDTALKDFAESITDTPQTLPRAIGIGLTLPGLTADSSMNLPVVGGFTPEYLMMCPPGVDPFAVTDSSSSGSGAASASGEAGAAESMSIEPGAAEASVDTGDSPSADCLGVTVFPTDAATDLGESGSIAMSVAGTTVMVISGSGNTVATADLGNGLTAVVGASASAQLSHADLAALAASVRLSPDVEVIPVDLSGSQGSGGTASAWSSASAVSSSAATVPSGTAGANPSATDSAIDVDRDDDVVAAVAADGATATVEFTLRNENADPRTLQSLHLDVSGMTQTGVKVRLDNTSADASATFQNAVLPAMFAPGTRVRVQVQFRVDQCSVVTSDPPRLKVEWQAESGGGGYSEGLPITSPAGGLEELLTPFCG